jgi:hypothetical protein
MRDPREGVYGRAFVDAAAGERAPRTRRRPARARRPHLTILGRKHARDSSCGLLRWTTRAISVAELSRQIRMRADWSALLEGVPDFNAERRLHAGSSGISSM